ncbi:hypothetical protein [Peribacillus butanolivorans]
MTNLNSPSTPKYPFTVDVTIDGVQIDVFTFMLVEADKNIAPPLASMVVTPSDVRVTPRPNELFTEEKNSKVPEALTPST